MNSSSGDFGGNTTVEACLARAELMFDLDHFDEAREELAHALTVDPAHVPSLTLLAVLELQVGNHDDALSAASAALAAEPTHEPAQFARGHALALLRRPDEAIDVAGQIQQRAPESWWHNVHFALIVRESRNGQDALDAAWVAVRLAPEEGRAHACLAVVAASLGLDELADRALQAAERCSPGIVRLLEFDLGPRLLRGRPDKPLTTRVPGDDYLTDPQPEQRERIPLPQELHRGLRAVSAAGIGVPLLSAVMSGGSIATGRMLAGIGAVAVAVILVVLVRRLPDHLRDGLRVIAAQDRLVGVGMLAAVAVPVGLAGFAFTGYIVFIVVSMIAAMLALAATALRR